MEIQIGRKAIIVHGYHNNNNHHALIVILTVYSTLDTDAADLSFSGSASAHFVK